MLIIKRENLLFILTTIDMFNNLLLLASRKQSLIMFLNLSRASSAQKCYNNLLVLVQQTWVHKLSRNLEVRDMQSSTSGSRVPPCVAFCKVAGQIIIGNAMYANTRTTSINPPTVIKNNNKELMVSKIFLNTIILLVQMTNYLHQLFTKMID